MTTIWGLTTYANAETHDKPKAGNNEDRLCTDDYALGRCEYPPHSKCWFLRFACAVFE